MQCTTGWTRNAVDIETSDDEVTLVMDRSTLRKLLLLERDVELLEDITPDAFFEADTPFGGTRAASLIDTELRTGFGAGLTESELGLAQLDWSALEDFEWPADVRRAP